MPRKALFTSASTSTSGAALLARVATAAVALAAAGCIVEQGDSPRGPARVEFGEVINLGYSCGGPLDTWTVKNRETEEQATGVCEQPILFLGLTPHASYTFDISGQTPEGRVCWTGSCQVLTGGEGSVTYPDCSSYVEHTCNL